MLTPNNNQRMIDFKNPVWDIAKVETDLQAAFDNNSETDLLEILKNNSFLFFHLYSRKGGIQPVFREISFGGKFRCDFAWLNDNSDGPEWVLMELEKPKMRIFNANGKPAAEMNGAIEQVRTWERYFHENPAEKKRIFGAVAKFRFILVAGDKIEWDNEHAMKWRTYYNTTNHLELRSTNVFSRALNDYKNQPNEFWSFEENPKTLGFSELEEYWKTNEYMDIMRKFY